MGLRNVDERLRATFGNDHGLTIETGVGAGTKVTMRLPKFSPRGERSVNPLPTSPPATHARTASALVIDDEAPARDELSYLLRTAFSITPVDAAENSSDAFRYLQERSYDVVFLDVRMPALNGIELGNVLCRFATPPAIVFVTAFEEYAVRAFEIGACDYLLKPVSRARLGTALGRALGRSPDHPDSPDDDPFATIPRGDRRAHEVCAP